jgi:hypothetical protein
METIYDVFRRLVAGKQLSEPEQALANEIIDQADPATRKDDDAEAHA